MTAEENEPRQIAVETNSERYGNTTTIEDVFDNLAYPEPPELEEALITTGFLTDKEAFAFVRGHIEGFPQVPHELDKADELVQQQGFENISEFESVRQTAKEKIADAIWIYELIDAYRLPDFSNPEKCDECGDLLGQTWIGKPHEEGLTIQCVDCADTEPESRPDPLDSTSTPEYCDECGDVLGHTWVGDHRKDDATIQCLDCADIDPNSRYYPFDSTAGDE